MAINNSNPRHQPCYVLHDHRMPCVVWFEDAIAYYGVPTVVFDLYVLVSDIETATQVLIQNRWTLVPQEKGKIRNTNVNYAQRRLTPLSQNSHDAELSKPHPHTTIPPPPSTKPPGPTTTVLLPAADWNFNLEEYTPENTKTLVTTIFPPIAGLLDALIDSLLDCPSNNDMLQIHIALQIAYLYDWAPVLQERTFTERLMYEHRQYHLDVLSGMSHGTAPFISHQRNVREALRQRTHELQECSARDNKALFSGEREAQLLASMHNPFPEKEEDWKEEDGWEVYNHLEKIGGVANGYFLHHVPN